MRIHRFLRRLWWIGAIVAMVAPSILHACHCYPPAPADALLMSDATFSGTILDSRRIVVGTDEYDQAVVRIENCWKGDLRRGQDVVVWTHACVGCCTQWLPQGEHMVLFVLGSGAAPYSTSFCVPNALFGPWVLDALGPPGCQLAIERSSWTAAKRLYATQ